MPTFRIPIALRKVVAEQAEVQVKGSTAGEALENLFKRYPKLKEALLDDQGELITTTYESFNLVLGSEDIRELQGRDTVVNGSDRILILRTWPAAISGGRQWNQPAGAPPPE